MEFIEGESPKGPMSLDDALRIARQIADGLEAAHDKGITHRDLKPGNIKIKPDGTVKVLDFGLAKIHASPASSGENSPTLTIGMTQAGMILGTAAYMAPEQARGKESVDKRADIWVFGVVLHEMLTGKRLFQGEDVGDTLASVIKEQPNLNDVPQQVRPLLKRCLEKDPRQRLRDIGDLELLLSDAPVTSAPSRLRLGRLAGVIAVLTLITVASLVFALWNRPTAVQRTEARLTIPLPPGQEITSYPAVTRDGRTVAYVTQQGTDDAQLYLGDLNAFEARAVAGSSGARQPFFSPDGKWVAFFAHGQLQKAEVAGGAPIRLAEIAVPFGGTWNEDNTIIYAGSLNSGLLRIPASGGTPESLTKPDGAANGYAHAFPQALPGGRNVLFAVWGQRQGKRGALTRFTPVGNCIARDFVWVWDFRSCARLHGPPFGT